MLAPLLAALACITTPPPAQSLPLDAGPVSMAAADPISTMPATAATATTTSDDAMTPATVECEVVETPMLALADCASLWTTDMIGTCDLPRASHSRAATLRRGRGPISGFGVAAGRVGEAPEILVPDSHATPPLLAASAQLAPPPLHSLLAIAAFGSPPSARTRRLDRPPRA